MTDELYALISYRMERASESLDEAKLMLDAGRINAHVNRLYYACFYAVSALLLTRDFSTSKHGYLRSLMHREFVKTGIIPKDLAKHFDVLFDTRLEGDYVDFVRFEAEDVTGWLENTERFIKHVESLIPKQT
jgi:uncharacterized protein (UPF0332 family)